MDEDEIRAELLALKDAALAATKRSDGAFYADYLDPQALAVLPVGILDRDAIVQAMGAAQPQLRAESIDDVRAVVLSEDCGVVTYRAGYPSGTVLVSTVYLRRPEGWRGVLYQQTPAR